MRWQDGYPSEQGASDFQDSSRLIGILAVFGFEINKIKYCDYMNYFNGPFYLRHPIEGNKYKYSRDQLICYAAGLKVLNLYYLSWSYYKPENGDWLSPSHNNHLIICAGFEPNLIGNLWLWLDVLYSCFIDPLAESNQLICMLMIHPNKAYLKFWCKWNKQWQKSIKNYWCENEGAWRGEPELAEIMIRKIESTIKTSSEI